MNDQTQEIPKTTPPASTKLPRQWLLECVAMHRQSEARTAELVDKLVSDMLEANPNMRRGAAQLAAYDDIRVRGEIADQHFVARKGQLYGFAAVVQAIEEVQHNQAVLGNLLSAINELAVRSNMIAAEQLEATKHGNELLSRILRK